MWTIQLILSAYNSRRARSSQARVLQRGRPDSRSVPQHLGSPDPTQGMGPSLPPRSSVASGFWFKARLSGKAVLGPQEQAADGGRSEFLTMGEPVETWVGKQCGEGLPSSQLLASYLEKVGSAASGARRLSPYWPLPSCPCSCLTCMFLYVQHTIGKTTQTASLRNCPCPSLQCQREPSQHATSAQGPGPGAVCLAISKTLSLWSASLSVCIFFYFEMASCELAV